MYAAQDVGVTSAHRESKPLLLCSPGKSSVTERGKEEGRRLCHLTTMSVSARAQGSTSTGAFTKPTAIELANPFKTGLTCLSGFIRLQEWTDWRKAFYTWFLFYLSGQGELKKCTHTHKHISFTRSKA